MGYFYRTDYSKSSKIQLTYCSWLLSLLSEGQSLRYFLLGLSAIKICLFDAVELATCMLKVPPVIKLPLNMDKVSVSFCCFLDSRLNALAYD